MEIKVTLTDKEVREAIVNYVRLKRDVNVEVKSITVKQVSSQYNAPTTECYTAELYVPESTPIPKRSQ